MGIHYSASLFLFAFVSFSCGVCAVRFGVFLECGLSLGHFLFNFRIVRNVVIRGDVLKHVGDMGLCVQSCWFDDQR